MFKGSFSHLFFVFQLFQPFFQSFELPLTTRYALPRSNNILCTPRPVACLALRMEFDKLDLLRCCTFKQSERFIIAINFVSQTQRKHTNGVCMSDINIVQDWEVWQIRLKPNNLLVHILILF